MFYLAKDYIFEVIKVEEIKEFKAYSLKYIIIQKYYKFISKKQNKNQFFMNQSGPLKA